MCNYKSLGGTHLVQNMIAFITFTFKAPVLLQVALITGMWDMRIVGFEWISVTFKWIEGWEGLGHRTSIGTPDADYKCNF